MYSRSQILSTDGLYTRIGLREPTKSGYTGKLDVAAKTTKSGFYYDRYHELANFINIYDCQNDPQISDADINTEIVSWRKEAIESGLAMVFEGVEDLIQNDIQFRNANPFDTTIENNGKFVGFEISVPDTDTVQNVLNSVIMQFDGVATFYLYLYHSSKKEYVERVEVTTVADDFYEKALALSLFARSTTYASGNFYLGYYQDDLGSVKAYDRQYSDSGRATELNCVGIRPFTVDPNGTDLFDITSIEYTNECFGMNLNISSYKDFTNLLMKNQELFDGVQGYAFAIKVLEIIKTTGRINPTQRVSENLPSIAAFELEDQFGGDSPRSIGLRTKLSREVDRARKSLLFTEKTFSYIAT